MSKPGNKMLRPSELDVAMYEVLSKAVKPLAVREITALSGQSYPGALRTLRCWLGKGLVKQSKLNSRGYYSWAPTKAGQASVAILEDSAALMKKKGGAPEEPNPAPGAPSGNDALIAELERRAAILLAAANVLKNAQTAS